MNNATNKYILKLLVILLVLLNHYTCLAQTTNYLMNTSDKDGKPNQKNSSLFSKIKASLPDSNYIKTYPKALIITIPLTVPYLKFFFKDGKTKNYLDFEPTRQYDLGLGINYKWFNIILGTGIAFYDKNDQTKGKTKYFDLQLNFNFRRFANDIYFQDSKGFYINNSNMYPGYISSNPYEVRTDVKATLFSINTNYIVNYKKFSYQNSFGFTETQLKSSGSFLIGGYYSLYTATSYSGIVSNSFKLTLDSLSYIKNGPQTLLVLM